MKGRETVRKAEGSRVARLNASTGVGSPRPCLPGSLAGGLGAGDDGVQVVLAEEAADALAGGEDAARPAVELDPADADADQREPAAFEEQTPARPPVFRGAGGEQEGRSPGSSAAPSVRARATGRNFAPAGALPPRAGAPWLVFVWTTGTSANQTTPWTRVDQLSSRSPPSTPTDVTTRPPAAARRPARRAAPRTARRVGRGPGPRRRRPPCRPRPPRRRASRGHPPRGIACSTPRLYRCSSTPIGPPSRTTCAAVSTSVSPSTDAMIVPLPCPSRERTMTVGRNVRSSPVPRPGPSAGPAPASAPPRARGTTQAQATSAVPTSRLAPHWPRPRVLRYARRASSPRIPSWPRRPGPRQVRVPPGASARRSPGSASLDPGGRLPPPRRVVTRLQSAARPDAA